jgi:hypothetical protein
MDLDVIRVAKEFRPSLSGWGAAIGRRLRSLPQERLAKTRRVNHQDGGAPALRRGLRVYSVVFYTK